MEPVVDTVDESIEVKQAVLETVDKAEKHSEEEIDAKEEGDKATVLLPHCVWEELGHCV
jgi:hypothetical protein